MIKAERLTRDIFAVILLIFMAVFGLKNIMFFVDSLRQNRLEYAAENNKKTKEMLSEVESDYREQFWHKKELVDIYGIYQKVLQRHMVGNFEYIADENGVLHMINYDEHPNVEGLMQEIIELKSIVDEKGIPMVYVQAPNREMCSGGEDIIEFTNNKDIEDQQVDILKVAGVNVLDLRYRILESDLGFDISDTYLHTDLHLGTDAEIWSANEVATYLDEELGVTLANQQYLQDKSLYDKKTYRMLGNYGRTNGTKFVSEDTFDIYHPLTETSFTYYVPGDEAGKTIGSFDEIMLNGYENDEANLDNPYVYWVTDFMHFMVPYYRYENNNCMDGKDLLIISDSIAYRSMTYMMMCCKSITILDPRWFGDVDYLSLAMKDDYDAVIVWQGTFLLGSSYIVK